MTAPRRPAPDPREREKTFRLLERAFVWAPPVLIVVIAGSVAALVAWALRFGGLNFWGRWGVAFALLVVIPYLAHLVTSRPRR